MDIWKEISLYLPYNVLALSSEFIKIYDESWFKSKLLRKHTNVNTISTWKNLYKKSLKSGNIIYA